MITMSFLSVFPFHSLTPREIYISGLTIIKSKKPPPPNIPRPFVVCLLIYSTTSAPLQVSSNQLSANSLFCEFKNDTWTILVNSYKTFKPTQIQQITDILNNDLINQFTEYQQEFDNELYESKNDFLSKYNQIRFNTPPEPTDITKKPIGNEMLKSLPEFLSCKLSKTATFKNRFN